MIHLTDSTRAALARIATAPPTSDQRRAPMTDAYRATPEQWAEQEEYSKSGNAMLICILELRARVEALEAAQQPATCPHIVSSDEGTSYCQLAEQGATVNDSLTPAPTGSLVERVAGAIADSDDPHELWYDDARAAIREQAAWLRERGHASAASALEREVGQ